MMKLIFKLSVKESVSILILILINFLFSFKYLARYTEFSTYISIGLSCVYLLLLTNFIKFKLNIKVSKLIPYVLIICFILISLFVLKNINVTTLNVDRWSVITSFWEAFFNGDYPYYAKSHMNNYPGPMPIYFLLALPFYLLNELGYFSLLGIVLLPIVLYKTKASLNYRLSIIIFVMSSTFYLWEVVSRSNIFTNSLIIVWALMVFIERKKENSVPLYFNAILIGLLLSTRAIFILPYIIFFIYFLKEEKTTISSFFRFSIIAMISFFASFLPFIFLFPDDFFTMNPFIIQSSFLLPSYFVILFILMSIVFSFLVVYKRDLFYYGGLSLFISIVVYLLYHSIIDSFKNSYLNSNVDISYFIFCIPFFIIYLLKRNLNEKLLL